jgi:hypothetical protein
MMTELEPRQEAGAQTPRGYEESDARLRPVLTFGAGLAVFALVVLLAMAGMFGYFARRQARWDRPLPPVAATPVPPVGPRLQTAPARDLKDMRWTEELQLSTYGWVDKEAGIVRIPIDRAMDLLAERGLPVRGEGGKGKN